jgi:hypothetical protein
LDQVYRMRARKRGTVVPLNALFQIRQYLLEVST